jgi:hypothetical protein
LRPVRASVFPGQSRGQSFLICVGFVACAYCYCCPPSSFQSVVRRDSICLHSFNRIGLGGSACRRAISFTADFSRHCVLPIEDFDYFRPAGFQCESRIETL